MGCFNSSPVIEPDRFRSSQAQIPPPLPAVAPESEAAPEPPPPQPAVAPELAADQLLWTLEEEDVLFAERRKEKFEGKKMETGRWDMLAVRVSAAIGRPMTGKKCQSKFHEVKRRRRLSVLATKGSFGPAGLPEEAGALDDEDDELDEEDPR